MRALDSEWWMRGGPRRARLSIFEAETVAVYDHIVGLDLAETSLEGLIHMAPVDRGKLGWKWLILADATGCRSRQSSVPTRGCRTPANCTATPTAESSTDEPDSP